MGDTFAGMRKASQAKRASNRDSSAQRLLDAKVPFVRKNGGAHLMLCDGKVHLWPGTGKWRDDRNGKNGRGVRSLLAHLTQARAAFVAQEVERQNRTINQHLLGGPALPMAERIRD